jgi:uncharacterized protein (DUF58 family)
MFKPIVAFYRSFYLGRRFWYIAMGIVLLMAMGFFLPVLLQLGKIGLLLLLLSVFTDVLLLYARKNAFNAYRVMANRFSNGDDNKVELHFQNNYTFPAQLRVIDELPVQFQQRNWYRQLNVAAGDVGMLTYTLRPVQRGEYVFYNLNVFVKSLLGIVIRRFSFPVQQTVMVYPSFVQMKRHSLISTNSQSAETGSKRLRKLGHSMEFEQIKDYVPGDDYRTVNWKASARKAQLMVNTFVDEKSQQVYCLIDKSRTMKMPFDGMALLDYAINASLVLSNIAIQKQDRAGLVTFAEKVDTFIPADRKHTQMEAMLESLYSQQTHFFDADYEALYAQIRNKIKQRSLLLLFTNFESLYALQRQLPYLRKMAHHHLLMVVFFENTEIKQLITTNAATTEEIYIQTIAEKQAYEKRQLVKELQKYGILSILTTPEGLTVNTINKYLEVKSRQAL